MLDNYTNEGRVTPCLQYRTGTV